MAKSVIDETIGHPAGTTTMPPHNPAHPGEVIRQACLARMNLTMTAAADALGMTRKALSDLLNGHAGVSPDLAIRLEQVFGGLAVSWLRVQRPKRPFRVSRAGCYKQCHPPVPPTRPHLTPNTQKFFASFFQKRSPFFRLLFTAPKETRPSWSPASF
jgi:addiction module HigA family antidote